MMKLISTIIVFAVCFTCSQILQPQVSYACQTSEGTLVGILDSSTTPVVPPLNPSSFAELAAAANLSYDMNMYDGLAQGHTAHIYLFKIDSPFWQAYLYFDGADIQGGNAGTPALVGIVTLSFDGSGNQLGIPSMILQINWSNGAPADIIRFFFAGFVQISASSRITYATQDGGTSGCAGRSRAVDFDGDQVGDYAIYRPGFGMWYIVKSSTSVNNTIVKQWGLPSDYPMPGDYTGDGKADLVVWRPTNGTWYVCKSETNFDCTQGIAVQWGLVGDRPISGDFDGDGIADYAIWRPEFGLFVYRSSSTGAAVVQQWGLPSDIPLQTGVNR